MKRLIVPTDSNFRNEKVTAPLKGISGSLGELICIHFRNEKVTAPLKDNFKIFKNRKHPISVTKKLRPH